MKLAQFFEDWRTGPSAPFIPLVGKDDDGAFVSGKAKELPLGCARHLLTPFIKLCTLTKSLEDVRISTLITAIEKLLVTPLFPWIRTWSFPRRLVRIVPFSTDVINDIVPLAVIVPVGLCSTIARGN